MNQNLGYAKVTWKEVGDECGEAITQVPKT